MEPSCTRQDLIPGTTRLFSSYLYHFDELNRYYPGGAPTLEQVVSRASDLSFSAQKRADIVAALREQNDDSAALDKLALPGTVAVVTGQQVGLFSGPAYTIFKALTAVKLAAEIEKQGTPSVPIFWLATEDHDLAEVDHTWVFNEKAFPVKVSTSGLVATGGPVGSTPLASVPIDELRVALGDLPFADEVIAKISTAYREGETLGGAFAALLKDILSGFGLLFLDPLRPAIRRLAAPFLIKAAQQAPQLVQDLQQRSKDLESDGYHAQVLVEKDSSLLFLLSAGKRLPLRMKDEKFASREGEFDVNDLTAIAERLSPNALLRPVLQDFLLPTVAYVGGPAEIAYFAQGSVLYQSLLGRMPVIFPRNGFTLLDDRALKLMNRNQLRLTDLLEYRESVKGRIAARLVPKDLQQEFAQLHLQVQASLAKLESDLHHFDPTLEAATKKSGEKILYQLSKLRSKTARETLRRDEKASADAEYLINLVFPNKHLQERLYSIVPFLAKYGLDLPQRLYSETQLSCPDHMLRAL